MNIVIFCKLINYDISLLLKTVSTATIHCKSKFCSSQQKAKFEKRALKKSLEVVVVVVVIVIIVVVVVVVFCFTSRELTII